MKLSRQARIVGNCLEWNFQGLLWSAHGKRLEPPKVLFEAEASFPFLDSWTRFTLFSKV